MYTTVLADAATETRDDCVRLYTTHVRLINQGKMAHPQLCLGPPIKVTVLSLYPEQQNLPW